MSESTTYKIIRWIFGKTSGLSGRKELLKSDMEYEVLVIDSTETSIDRPKKAKTLLFRKEEKTHSKNTDYYGKRK